MLSVGFRYGKTTDIPVSLYNEDIRKQTQPTCQVLLIERKLFKDKEYNDVTYIAKGYSYEDGKLVKKNESWMYPGVTLATKILMNIITVEKYTNNATKNYAKSIKTQHDIYPINPTFCNFLKCKNLIS